MVQEVSDLSQSIYIFLSPLLLNFGTGPGMQISYLADSFHWSRFPPYMYVERGRDRTLQAYGGADSLLYNWRAHFQNVLNPLLMKIEFLASLYRITLELVTEWNLDRDNSLKYIFF